MAYAAVISLKQTLHRLINSSEYISIAGAPTQQIMASAYEEMELLQQVLERLNDSNRSSTRLDDLDQQITEQVQKLEDVLEFHESDQFFPQSESSATTATTASPADVMVEIGSILAAAKKMEEEYIEELDNEDDDSDDDDVSSRIGCGGKMIRFSDDYEKIKEDLLRIPKRPDDFCVFASVGKIGSSRTMLAKILYNNLNIGGEQSLDVRVWVTIGPSYDYDDVLARILAQIDYDDDEQGSRSSVDDEDTKLPDLEGDDKSIARYVYTRLVNKRYMVVLDDVCDTHIWDYLRSNVFPAQNNGSLIWLTTSLMEVANYAKSYYIHVPKMYDDRQSWDLLSLLVFSREEWAIHPEVEQVGMRIVRNCQGLFLLVFKIILHLLRGEKTLEYLNAIADEANPIYMVADEIEENGGGFYIGTPPHSSPKNSRILRKSAAKSDFQYHQNFSLSNSVGSSIFEESQKIRKIKRRYNLALDNSDYRRIANILISLLEDTNIEDVKKKIFPNTLFPKMKIIALCGMVGIGKTTLAKECFEDPSILCCFDHSVWVTLGPKYHSENILVDILAQIHPYIDKLSLKGDVTLIDDLCTQLSDKRCLIVFDDVWSEEPIHYLKMLAPDIKGEAIMTTRLMTVAKAMGGCDEIRSMKLLNIDDSWSLICENVFHGEYCPRELEKPGRMIAEKCEGLPLMIVTIADILNKAEQTLDFWNMVATRENPVFSKAYSEIEKALLPSYNNLPQHLKACFLYMGVFPLNHKISLAKISRWWTAEGFLIQNMSSSIEDLVAEWLLEITERNVVMVAEKGSKYEIKTCYLHSVFWNLSNNLAEKKKFFHAFNIYTEDSLQGLESQRRLSIRNNTLLGIKKVDNSNASYSTLRSLLCTGPYHQYPVPIFSGLRLLRVLDALTIRLYEFPTEIWELFNLRYLALTCNGVLPSSIKRLWNLQFLIVYKHWTITYVGTQLYLPLEIWDMKNLRHLQFMGSSLPNPHCGLDLLPNLSTLSHLSSHNLTKRIVKRIRCLKKLGIQVQLAVNDDGKSFHSLNRISRLRKLESLRCVVLNPGLMSMGVTPPAPLSMFPSSLQKLHLSGLGYPWDYMSIIGSLPKLYELKLTCYAFRGPLWEAYNGSFKELKFLTIEDTDLIRWKIKVDGLLNLEYLSLKYCFKLQELPSFLIIRTINVVDCNPLVENWTEQMQEERLKHSLGPEFSIKLDVKSSWNAHGDIEY